MAGSSSAAALDTQPATVGGSSPDVVPLGNQLQDMQNVQLSIKSSLKMQGETTRPLDQLATLVHDSIDVIKSLIHDQTHIKRAAEKCLNKFVGRLRAVDNRLQKPAKQIIRFRSSYSQLQSRLEKAFKAFKDSMSSHVGERNSRWDTIRDTIERVLNVATSIKDIVGEPAGPIIGLLAGTGLSIIEMLRNMENNREDAIDLGKRIGELVEIISGFLKHRRSEQKGPLYEETVKHLELFSQTLKSVEKELSELKEQGRFKQGVSHTRNKEDIQGWKASIDDARTTFQFQLFLHTFDTTEAISQTVDRLELLSLLGDGDTGASEKVSDLSDLVCLPGTRGDILNKARDWARDPEGSRVFWISGVAGCGKSAVAATIADRQMKARAPAAVFHFARANQIRNKRVLCSLARQVTSWHNGFLEPSILASLRDDRNLATKPIASQFQRLLVDPIKGLPSSHPVTLLILDALDEWDNHDAAKKLLDLIADSNADLPRSLRFVLTSRNENHLVNRLTSVGMQPFVTRYMLDTIPLAEANHDIGIYVEKRFTRIRSASKARAPLGDDWPGQEDTSALVKESGGLFQWAATAMGYVEVGGPRRRLREILDHSERYKGLENLYQGILNILFQTESPDVLKLLQDVLGAILVAPTPINLPTIAYMCCGDTEGVTEMMETIEEDVLAFLGSLLIIPAGQNDPIKIAHPTVYDIFTTATKCTDPRFHVNVVSHSERVALSCLEGMTRSLEPHVNSVLDISKTSAELQEKALQSIPAGLLYSCEYWSYYLLRSCRHAEERKLSPGLGALHPSQQAPESLCSEGQTSVTKKHQALYDFCTSVLFSWLESLSLIGLSIKAVNIILDAELWYSRHLSSEPSRLTRSLLTDMRRFATTWPEPIAQSAPHIRVSVLPYAPRQTDLYIHYSGTVAKSLKLLRTFQDDHWPAALWTSELLHKGLGVHAIAFSPDGMLIASGACDSTLRLWHTDSGAAKGDAFVGHSADVRCMAFSPDGKMLVSGSEDCTLRRWNVDTGTERGPTSTGHTGTVLCLVFAPDGKIIVTGSEDCTIRIWSSESGAQQGRTLTEHTGWIHCLAFRADGRTIVSGSVDTTLRFWDASTGMPKGDALTGHTGMVRCLAIAPDDKTIATGSDDFTVRLWNADSGAPNGGALVGHQDIIRCISFAPDGKTLASGSGDHTICLWDPETRVRKMDPLVGHDGTIRDLTWTLDGKTLISISQDRSVRQWDVETGIQRGGPMLAHQIIGMRVALSPCGKTLASAAWDTTIVLWDLGYAAAQPEVVTNNHLKMVIKLEFSPDGNTIATSGLDASLCLWDAKTGAQKVNPFDSLTNGVRELIWSADGKTFGIHNTTTIRVFDVSGSIPIPMPLRPEDEALYPIERRIGSTKGETDRKGWVTHRGKCWFWLPGYLQRWSLSGNIFTFAVREKVVIMDVSDIMYIVE